MKKILLSLIAVMITAIVSAQPLAVRQQMLPFNVKEATTVKDHTLRTATKGLKLNQKRSLKKATAPKKVESLENYAGDYIAAYFNYELENSSLIPATVARNGYPVSVEVVDDNTINILGFFYGDETSSLTAKVADDGSLTIEAGQVIADDSNYGDVKMINAQAETDDEPLTGQLYANGIVIDQIWYGQIDIDGTKYRYTDYLATDVMLLNGIMSFTDSKGVDIEANVFIEQDRDNPAIYSIYNFGDYHAVVDVELSSDKKFSVDESQIVASSSSGGDFSPYALNGNYLDILAGSATETMLTTNQSWTFYSNKGYWYGEQGPFTVELIDGTEFEFPEAETGELVEAPEGEATEYPFSAKLYDIDGSQNPDYKSTVKIIWQNNEVYIQGVDKYLPEAWIKGTYDKAKGTVIVPVTYMGQYEGSAHFLAGYSPNGPRELTLNYDADAKTFEYSATIMIYKGSTGTSYSYFFNGFFIGEKPSPTTAPEGLVTVEMPFAGNYFSEKAEEATEANGTVKVGRDGDDFYIQGLFESLVPGGWIKGTITTIGENKYVVFAKNQYVGDLSNGLAAYLTGYLSNGEGSGNVSDVFMLYNEEYNFFTAITPVILTRFKNSTEYTAFFQGGLTIGEVPSGISTVKNSKNDNGAWYTTGGQRVVKPTQKGLYIQNGKKYIVK